MPDPVSIVNPRVDEKPWGGDALTRFGIVMPDTGPIGEALLTSADATVAEGYRAGQTIGAIVDADPERFLGDRARAVLGDRSLFPLLAKLIDAHANLSIQVHPDDVAAAALNSPGKTEAWHVLAARPGARLYAGLRPGVPLATFIAMAEAGDGSCAAAMRTVPAITGTTILLPAGTIHALGAGVVVYEIQQPSDITFRIDDWGRTDAHGHSRELHLDEGRTAARPELLPELIPPVRRRAAIGERHILTACRYFAVERIALPAGGSLLVGSATSAVVVTILTGSAELGDHRLGPGKAGVIWPLRHDPTTLRATAPMVALVAWVPDLVGDVIGPGRASGAGDDAIAALSGPSNDLGALLAGERDTTIGVPSPAHSAVSGRRDQ